MVEIVTIVGVLVAACAAWYQYRSYKIARDTKPAIDAQFPLPIQLTIQSNIPAPGGTFIGRNADEQRVAAKINGRWPIIMIEGLGGVGKTALAISIARQSLSSGRFDVVAWTSARDNPLTVDDLLDTVILRVFGSTHHGLTARADKEALAARLLREHKTLLVIDNLDTIRDDDVRKFALHVPEPSKVLLTSRHADVALAADIHHLAGLSDQDGAELIRLLASEDDRTQAIAALSEDRLESLSRAVGGLPLMLRWVVGQSRTLPLDALLQSIASVKGDASTVYEFIFLKSYAALSETGKWVLASVSIFASSVRLEAIHRSTGRDYFDVARAVTQTVDLCLLEATSALSAEERLYSLHPLTRYYIQGVLRDNREVSRAIHVNAGSWLLEPGTRRAMEAEAIQELHEYVNNALAVARWCVENYHGATVLAFRNSISRDLWVRGLWRRRIELGRLAHEAARYTGDFTTLASILIDDLGWTTFALSRSDAEAKRYIEEGRAVCRTAGNKYLEAKATRHLAVIARDRGEYDLADRHFVEAMAISASIESEAEREEMTTNILDMIGVMQLKQGKLEDAKQSFYSATEGFRRLNDGVRLSKVFNHLAQAFEFQGKFSDANIYFSKALEQATAARRLDEKAHALFGLARMAAVGGSRQEAMRYLENARVVFTDLGDLRALEKLEAWEANKPCTA